MIRTLLGPAVVALLLLAPSAHAQSKCTSAQWKTATKLAADLGKCESKGAKKGFDADPACLAKGETKFDKGMAKAANKGDCIAEVDEAAAQATVDQFVAKLRREIDPGPAVCCEGADSSPCIMFVDEAGCTDEGGVVGPPATSCDASGTGCVAEAVVPGNCCEDFVEDFAAACFVGTFSQKQCVSIAGSYEASGVCDTNGRCQALVP